MSEYHVITFPSTADGVGAEVYVKDGFPDKTEAAGQFQHIPPQSEVFVLGRGIRECGADAGGTIQLNDDCGWQLARQHKVGIPWAIKTEKNNCCFFCQSLQNKDTALVEGYTKAIPDSEGVFWV